MIHLTNISKNYGTRVLYQNASFQVRPGDRIGLVGPNGAGKTTIFRVITGTEGVDGGEVNIADRLVIGYFQQDVGEMKGRTVIQEVMAGAGRISDLAEKIRSMEKKLEMSAVEPLEDDDMSSLLDQYGEAQLEFEQRGGYDLDSRAKAIVTGLGIKPEEHHRPIESFSGGWKMRVELAKILVLNPDVLLMDEPTNHLDLESIVWLEEWLMNFKGALVMTSHDREFMNRVVNRTVEIANKQITTYSGNYEFYLRERQIRLTQLLSAHKSQQAMLAKEEEFIAKFAARASHAAQVQSRVKKLDKLDRIEIPAEERTVNFDFPVPPRSGNDVVKLARCGKEYKREDGSIIPVFKGASGTVKRLDKVAVVGVNGAGKSTLLKIIAGLVEPTEGDAVIGASVSYGYFSQHALDVLNPEKTIFDEIHDRIPEATIGYVRNLLGSFLFTGDDAYKKIGVLSGGEKSRVVLATLLAKPLNFLILDEPTNHLDIKSREILLESLINFEGTVILVSHDRHFLKSVATRVFEVDRGEVRIYEGPYRDYLEQKTAHA